MSENSSYRAMIERNRKAAFQRTDEERDDGEVDDEQQPLTEERIDEASSYAAMIERNRKAAFQRTDAASSDDDERADAAEPGFRTDDIIIARQL